MKFSPPGRIGQPFQRLGPLAHRLVQHRSTATVDKTDVVPRERSTERRAGPSPIPRRERQRLFLLPPGEGGPKGRMKVRAEPGAIKHRETLGAAPSPATKLRESLSRRTLTPTPLPMGEGLYGSASASDPRVAPGLHASVAIRNDPAERAWVAVEHQRQEQAVPSPVGRRWPEGPDEGTGEAWCNQTPRVAFAPDPHPPPKLRETLSRRTLTPTPLPVGEGLLAARACRTRE
ncbi:hypothetical protein NB712_002903 [Xanthomonas sacchari]|nr:hypothetical protein [Xanthomonas sacchari]